MERALVIFPKGGLANRLRATASGWLLARACGRSFHVNWRPDDVCGAEWGELFQNRFSPHPMDAAELCGEGMLHRDGEGARLPEGMARAVSDDPRPVIGIQTSQLFRPPGCENFGAARGEFYRSLIPVAEVQDTVCEFMGAVDVRQMVGVHIRRGDLVSDKGHNSHAISPIGDFIKRCRAELASRRPAGFFLATDSPRDDRELRRVFGPLVFSRSGRVMERNCVAGIRDALVDWLLLSQTQFVIRSYYTSFSKEACTVNGIRSFVVLRDRPPLAAFLTELAHRSLRLVRPGRPRPGR